MKPASHPYVVSGKLQKEDPEKYAAVIDFLKYYYGTEGTRIIVEENQSVPVTKYTGTVDSAEYPVFHVLWKRSVMIFPARLPLPICICLVSLRRPF